MSGDEAGERNRSKRAITSEGLATKSVVACWSVSVLLLGCGIAATFLVGTGAAPAAMILLGSLFLVLALMRRVPLSLEVGGAKFDASYEVDEAYDAGRDYGRRLGVEDALTDVEKAKERGEPVDEALQALRERLVGKEPVGDSTPSGTTAGSVAWTGTARGHAPPVVGYRGPIAGNAAGVSDRQLDYWIRTELVEPSLRPVSGNERLFSAHDILLLRVTKRLLDAGVSLQQIRTLVDYLRKRGPHDQDQLVLMSDGNSLWEATSSEEVIDLLHSGDGMFGIAIGSVRRDLLAVLAELPSEPARARSDEST
ncbi:helix-turn-helix domain-containing protein [Segeticoccus rhizosphaerae]|uniref:helix-turn-helix domain-containing protein n=1 Tax=Segeticoccus rhizosphaerae TaxID=1104777 RepID=UPI003083DB4B